MKRSFSKKLRVLLLVVKVMLVFNGSKVEVLTDIGIIPDVPSVFVLCKRSALLPAEAFAG